jgi:hypothetical protein
MKRVFTLSLALGMSIATGFASSAVSPAPPAPLIKATEMRIPVGNTGKFINLQELSTIKVADFEKMTGKKMGLFRRMEFKLAQKQIRHSIDKDGMVSNKKLAKLAPGYYDEDKSFHFGGFALGFFLGLIGILIAYIINDDNHSRRVRWAWYGFGIYVVILLIAIAATAG